MFIEPSSVKMAGFADDILNSKSSELCNMLLMDSNISRKVLRPQSLLISALYTRDSHPKLTGFLELIMKKNELDFFKLSRVTKSTFNLLQDMLASDDKFKTTNFGGRPSIGVEASLMITLWYLGRQCTYSEICEQFGISMGSAHNNIERVISVIIDKFKNVIKWPSIEKVSEIEKEFRSLYNFPGVIAAIDGCHIKIKAPEEFQKDYLDRTMTHSVNLLAACDANKKFLFIGAGFPGSAHDQRVLSNSLLGQQLQENYKSLCYSDKYHIIGDSAFALKPYMMVPYRDTGDLDAKKLRFNIKLSATRRVIENSFAFLKGRFRRLKYIDSDLKRVTRIIKAACILHIITMDSDKERELINHLEIDQEIIEDVITNIGHDSVTGIKKRTEIMKNL